MLLLPYLNHAVRLLESGHAKREDIDKAATGGLGLPMGPLALLDLIGLDTSLSILEALHAEFGGSRYAPAPLLRSLAEAGLTGRKSGRGFYEYPASGGRGRPGHCGGRADAPGAGCSIGLRPPGACGRRASCWPRGGLAGVR
jgi:3-hydroxybutyryl-CoA dehydrogenase